MSEKVVISNELAEMIHAKLDGEFTKEELITWHVQNRFGVSKKLNKSEGSISTEDLVKAVYIGFTTPATLNTYKFSNLSESEREEVNKELVETLDRLQTAPLFTYEDGFKDGTKRTLEKLGIKLGRK